MTNVGFPQQSEAATVQQLEARYYCTADSIPSSFPSRHHMYYQAVAAEALLDVLVPSRSQAPSSEWFFNKQKQDNEGSTQKAMRSSI